MSVLPHTHSPLECPFYLEAAEERQKVAALRKRVEELEAERDRAIRSARCYASELPDPGMDVEQSALAQAEARAEKAERERDEAMADLDAALDWIIALGVRAVYGVPNSERIKALLEKRREQRG